MGALPDVQDVQDTFDPRIAAAVTFVAFGALSKVVEFAQDLYANIPKTRVSMHMMNTDLDVCAEIINEYPTDAKEQMVKQMEEGTVFKEGTCASLGYTEPVS